MKKLLGILLCSAVLFTAGCNSDPTGGKGPTDEISRTNPTSESKPNSQPDSFTLEGTDTGGGGDPIIQDVYRVIENIIFELEQIESSDPEAFSMLNKFLGLHSTISIEVYNHLKLNGKDIGAINYPRTGLIQINRDRWNNISSELGKTSFVLHELMGLASIIDPKDYSLSNRWGKVLFRGVPEVCRRSDQIVMSLQNIFEKECSEITLENLLELKSLKIENIGSSWVEIDSEMSDEEAYAHELTLNYNLKKYEKPELLWNLRHDDLLGLDNLEDLDLSETQLVNFDLSSFANLRNLRRLNLSENFLTFLPENFLSGLEELEYLNLASNRLEGLTQPVADKLPNLKSLLLSSNKTLFRIDPIFFESMVGLKLLAMDDLDSLENIANNTFLPLASLRFLHLNNFTGFLHENSFSGLNNLEELFITNWWLDPRIKKLPWQTNRDHMDAINEFYLSYKIPPNLFTPLESLIRLSLYRSDEWLFKTDEPDFLKEMLRENTNLQVVCLPSRNPNSLTGCQNLLDQSVR